MNIKQALLHNTVWKVITMLFTFVNNIIIVRMLGADAGASFFYAIAVFTLLSTVLRLGLENGIVYYASKYPARTAPLAVFITAITFGQIVIAYAALHYFITEAAPYTLGWCSIFVVANVLIYYATAFYQVKRMYISINVSSAAVALIQTLVFLSFYYTKVNIVIGSGLAKNINDAILFVLAAGTLTQLIFLAVWFIRINGYGLRLRLPDSLTVKNVMAYSMMNFAATVLMFLVMRADFYFVEKYCSSVTLANYIQVAKVGQMALVFPGLLGGVIFPYTVNASESFSEKISFFCRVLTTLFIVLFIIFLAAGKFIFTRLFGPDYNLVYPGLCFSLPGVYCLAINLVLVSYFEGKNMQRIVLLSNAVVLLIILGGDYILVPLHGYLAAAAVFSVANMIGMVILLRKFIRKADISLKNIFFFHPSDSFIFRFWR